MFAYNAMPDLQLHPGLSDAVSSSAAGTCSLAADPNPPVTADQCSAAAFNWLGDTSKAALAYNYTAASCDYASKIPSACSRTSPYASSLAMCLLLAHASQPNSQAGAVQLED